MPRKAYFRPQVGITVTASQGMPRKACLARHTPQHKWSHYFLLRKAYSTHPVGTLFSASQGIPHTPSGYITYCLAGHSPNPSGYIIPCLARHTPHSKWLHTVTASHVLTPTSSERNSHSILPLPSFIHS